MHDAERGLLVRVEPRSQQVVGFSIPDFKAWHAATPSDDGDFEIDLPPDLAARPRRGAGRGLSGARVGRRSGACSVHSPDRFQPAGYKEHEWSVESQRVEDFRLTQGALLPAPGQRGRALRGGLPRAPSGDAQGPHRLRQDALRRAHELAPEAHAGDRRLPRGPDRVGPGRQVHPARRRDDLAGRPAHHRGQGRRDRLPGRGRRGAQGHHRRHPPAHRRPAHPAAREEGRDRRGAGRVPAGDQLQPGLPVGAEGPQALDQAAVRGDRVRLPAAGARGGRS